MGVDFVNNFSCIFSKLQGLCEFEKKNQSSVRALVLGLQNNERIRSDIFFETTCLISGDLRAGIFLERSTSDFLTITILSLRINDMQKQIQFFWNRCLYICLKRNLNKVPFSLVF